MIRVNGEKIEVCRGFYAAAQGSNLSGMIVLDNSTSGAQTPPRYWAVIPGFRVLQRVTKESFDSIIAYQKAKAGYDLQRLYQHQRYAWSGRPEMAARIQATRDAHTEEEHCAEGMRIEPVDDGQVARFTIRPVKHWSDLMGGDIEYDCTQWFADDDNFWRFGTRSVIEDRHPVRP